VEPQLKSNLVHYGIKTVNQLTTFRAGKSRQKLVAKINKPAPFRHW